MFYCDPCRVKNNWPEGLLYSLGKCELCNTRALCYDRPSRSLPEAPKREPTINIRWQLRQSSAPVEIAFLGDITIGSVSYNITRSKSDPPSNEYRWEHSLPGIKASATTGTAATAAEAKAALTKAVIRWLEYAGIDPPFIIS